MFYVNTSHSRCYRRVYVYGVAEIAIISILFHSMNTLLENARHTTSPTAGWLSASQPLPHPTKSKTLSAFCNTKSHRLRHRNLCRERCEHVRLGRVVKDFTNYRTTTYAAAITKEEEVSPSVEKSETTRPFIFFFRQRDSSRLTHS